MGHICGVYKRELLGKIIKRDFIRNTEKKGLNAITIYTLKIHFKGGLESI